MSNMKVPLPAAWGETSTEFTPASYGVAFPVSFSFHFVQSELWAIVPSDLTQTPKTTTMDRIHIHPVTDSEDFHVLVGIEERAYGAASPMMRLMFGTASSDLSQNAVHRSKIERHQKTWKQDSSVWYLKATIKEEGVGEPTNEQIVGMAVYHVYTNSTPLAGRNPWPKTADEVPEGANEVLCLHYFHVLTKRRLDFMDGRPHAFLASLVIDPRFQGKGIRKMLIDFMLAEIFGLRNGDEDREGHNLAPSGTGKDGMLPCWLDASPSGLKLYQRLGWKEVSVSEFNLEQWGGGKGQVHKDVHMVKWIL